MIRKSTSSTTSTLKKPIGPSSPSPSLPSNQSGGQSAAAAAVAVAPSNGSQGNNNNTIQSGNTNNNNNNSGGGGGNNNNAVNSGGGVVGPASIGFDSSVQHELDELQRKYRIMEGNRKSYAEESQNTLRMQKQQIEKLKRDNERLKEELALETRQAKQANNLSAASQIARLQDQGDLYTRKIELEKRRIEELDKQIKKMQSAILMQKKEMGGVNANRENTQAVQKQIRILENRLDKALVKFNEALAHNKSLRETIDNLRRERIVFDGIYRKLERELAEKKNKMAQIIEISNAAYEAREEAQKEMILLKNQADKEQNNFENEWSKLAAAIEKDKKVKDFIKGGGAGGGSNNNSVGGVMGSTKTNNEKFALLTNDRIGDSRSRGIDPALEEESKLKRKVTKGAWSIAKDKAAIHLSMEKVQAYEEAFAKIQKATKITDIDELVSTFIRAEDTNFSLFNYVNDLSNEIEKLEESINEIKEEIKKYKGQGKNTDNQRKKVLEELEEKLIKTEEKASLYEEKYQTALRTVNGLKAGIESIFHKIGANNSAVSELLGTAGVTESNMMQYLGIIEQRTNELLQLYANHRADEEAFEKEKQNEKLLNGGNNNNNINNNNNQNDGIGGGDIDGLGLGVGGMEEPHIDAPSMGVMDDDDQDEQDEDPIEIQH